MCLINYETSVHLSAGGGLRRKMRIGGSRKKYSTKDGAEEE
jgi:hypothetical protein